MAKIHIHLAASQVDFADARDLCRAWVDWQLRTFPEHREKIAKKFQSGEYDRTIADLPRVHAAPKGAVLLAKLEGETVGCVMYDEMEPQVAEVHRLYVLEAGWGNGLGRALLEAMFKQMRSDGYAKARFSSAKHLTHARRLYERVGFRDISAPTNTPEHVYFMERDL